MKPLDPRLLCHARPVRAYMALLVAAGMTMTILAVVQCCATAATLARLASCGGSSAGLGLPLDLVAGALAGRTLVGYAQETTGHRAAPRATMQLRGRVLNSAADRGQRWLADGKTSPIITLAAKGLGTLEPYFIRFLPQLILTCLATPTTLAAVMWPNWTSATAILAYLSLIPILMVLMERVTQAYSNERLRATQCLGSQLFDPFVDLSTLKGLGREPAPRKRVKDLDDSYVRTTMETLYAIFLSGAVLEFLATVSIALVTVEVGLRMVGGGLDLSSGLTIIMLILECFRPFREARVQFHASADDVTAAESIFDILEDEGETEASRKMEAPGRTVSDLSCLDLAVSPMIFDWFSVTSPGRTAATPLDLMASIEPGKITAFRGRSGTGKSIAAVVVLRLVFPTSGSVRIERTPIERISKESLWRQISWASQRPAIPPGTVLENMGCFLGGELEWAASVTGSDDVTACLPGGWNVRIGHGGVDLLVGQRQRLALACILVKPRPFMPLDEPSAHPDAAPEKFVAYAVHELRATGYAVFVVARRSALIEGANAVVDVAARSSVPERSQALEEAGAAEGDATSPTGGLQ